MSEAEQILEERRTATITKLHLALHRLDDIALYELASVIEHILFARQRGQRSSDNTVVAQTEDCF